jgi:hypothetical protein
LLKVPSTYYNGVRNKIKSNIPGQSTGIRSVKMEFSGQEKKLADSYLVERPFYFIVVVWGEDYTRCFLEYCVASLLAPGNLPCLRTRQRSKFLIATRPDDWRCMQTAAIFREAARYVDLVFLEIPPCPAGALGCVHMGKGHLLACRMAHRDKAYAIVFTPESIISDGTVRNLQAHAAAGVELVWVAALRFAEEPFLGHLKALGVLTAESRMNSGAPLVVSGRELVFAGINSMHSETLSYEWEASYFPNMPSAAWWRVPGENGIVLHSLSWAPFLLDFAAVKTHDSSALETWTIDGDYAFKNLGDDPKIHVVQDSDEMFYCSWSPLSDRAIKLQPRYTSKFSWMNSVKKIEEFSAAFYGSFYDPLKRKVFFLPVRWHANPITPKWRPTERKAQRALRRVWSKSRRRALVSIARPWESGIMLWESGINGVVGFCNGIGSFCNGMGSFCDRIVLIGGGIRKNQHVIARRLKELLCGEPRARARIAWRIRQAFVFILSGRRLPELADKG